MTYGDDTFGFGLALRVCLGGGLIARKGWEDGVNHIQRVGDSEYFDPFDHYPAGSYLYLPGGAPSSVMVREDKATGEVEAVHAMRGMHLNVHKPGKQPEDEEWVLHSSELFAVDWVEVYRDEAQAVIDSSRRPVIHSE